ncbi:MAG: DUF6602 domain-containing protein [Caldilineaceae bacterium]
MSLYRNFAGTLALRLESSLSLIQAGHNFEYGPEFEITLCDMLRSVLPNNYGIARGFLTTENSTIAGDDIIIYERSRFPALALREQDNFARKEFIPVEAAYCYIEAKHTVVLDDDGPSSLKKAYAQVAAAKNSWNCAPVSPNQLKPYTSTENGIKVNVPPECPKILNPPYGMILARQVRIGPRGDIVSDPAVIDEALQKFTLPDGPPPDLISLGASNVCVPTLTNEANEIMLRSPFYIEGRSKLVSRVVENKYAFSVAFMSLMAALDWIELGVLPWHRIIVDALGIPYE